MDPPLPLEARLQAWVELLPAMSRARNEQELAAVLSNTVLTSAGITPEKQEKAAKQKQMRVALLKSVLKDFVPSSAVESLPLSKAVHLLAQQLFLALTDAKWAFKEWALVFALLEHLLKMPFLAKNGDRLEATWISLITGLPSSEKDKVSNLKSVLRFLIVERDWAYSPLGSLRRGEIIPVLPRSFKYTRDQAKVLLLSLTHLLGHVLPTFKGEFKKIKIGLPKRELQVKIARLERIYQARRRLVQEVLENLVETLHSTTAQKWNESLFWYKSLTQVLNLLLNALEKSLAAIEEEKNLCSQNLPEDATQAIEQKERLIPFSQELSKLEKDEPLYSLATPETLERLMKDPQNTAGIASQLDFITQRFAGAEGRIKESFEQIDRFEHRKENLRLLDLRGSRSAEEKRAVEDLQTQAKVTYRILTQLEVRLEFLKSICNYALGFQKEIQGTWISPEEPDKEAKTSEWQSVLGVSTTHRRKTPFQAKQAFISLFSVGSEEEAPSIAQPLPSEAEVPAAAKENLLPWEQWVYTQPLTSRLDKCALLEKAQEGRDHMGNVAYHLAVLQSILSLGIEPRAEITAGLLRTCSVLVEQALSARLLLEQPQEIPGHRLSPMVQAIGKMSEAIHQLAKQLDYGVVSHRYPNTSHPLLQETASLYFKELLTYTSKTYPEMEHLVQTCLKALQEIFFADSLTLLPQPTSLSAKNKARLKNRLEEEVSKVQQEAAKVQDRLAQFAPQTEGGVRTLCGDIALHLQNIQGLLTTLRNKPTAAALLAVGDPLLMHLQYLDEQVEQAIHLKHNKALLPTHSVQAYRKGRGFQEAPHHQHVVKMLDIQILDHYPAYRDPQKSQRGFLAWRLEAQKVLAQGETAEREAVAQLDFVKPDKKSASSLLNLQDQLIEWTRAVMEMTQGRLDLIR